jgi:TolB-like protein/DNA-binding winged helix-turn-helix (wHTH) protein
MDQQTTAGKGVRDASYRVAGWSVDPVTLRIRNHEKEVKIEPKAMAVLEYLAARPGQVVSRQNLEDAVWTDVVVGYDAITNAIIKLRKAFGDEAQDPQIIETIPKTGYRLIATVELSAPDFNGDERSKEIDAGHEISARSIKVAVTIFLPLVLLIVIALLWFRSTEQIVEPASKERMAFPLPDKPSIAVLPFSNLSDDRQQDYFADGMTEDLITDISKVNGLFVVARNSVFTYKGKTVKVRQIAEELGVRYVMEGSVRRVGDQVRINAQLIDATTGGHIWAERYDGSLENIFSMQDKITKKIVTAIASSNLTAQESGINQIETSSTEAYDAYLRGWERYRLGSPEDLSKAVFYFEQAIELDPNYARAHSALAGVFWTIFDKGWWNKSLHASASQATERSRIALVKAMEHPSALTHQVASERAAYFQRKPDTALFEAERAIDLDNNDPAGHLAMANALLKANRAAEAVESVRTAMRLDPHFPASYLTRLGQAQFANGQYQNAAETLEIAARRNPGDDWTFVYLAAAHGQLGNARDAKFAVGKANELRANEGWGVMTSQNTRRRNDRGGLNYFHWVGDYEPLREGLRKAGVTTEADWRSLVSTGPSGPEVKGATTIDAETAKTLHDRGVPFIDIFVIGLKVRIPNAFFLEEFTDEFNDARLAAIVDKHQEVVIYSSRSDDNKYAPRSTARAVSWGYERVYFFRDGLDKWKAAGYPLEMGKK